MRCIGWLNNCFSCERCDKSSINKRSTRVSTAFLKIKVSIHGISFSANQLNLPTEAGVIFSEPFCFLKNQHFLWLQAKKNFVWLIFCHSPANQLKRIKTKNCTISRQPSLSLSLTAFTRKDRFLFQPKSGFVTGWSWRCIFVPKLFCHCSIGAVGIF